MLPDLKQKLEAAARASGRSLNGEITARLERSLTEDARSVLADRLREVDETGVSEPRAAGEPLRYAPGPADQLAEIQSVVLDPDSPMIEVLAKLKELEQLFVDVVQTTGPKPSRKARKAEPAK
jgi:hypothetical protein